MGAKKTALPSIFLSNVQSLLPKFDEICTFASTERPDVMIFCETWLNETIENKLIHIPGFSVPMRHDRFSKRGGGVCIYSREEVTCRQITDLASPPNFIECVWSVFSACKIVVLALYVPPNLHACQQSGVVDYIISQADIALNLIEDGRFVIAGDLNQLPTSALESTLSLSQRVNIPTRGLSILDKVLLDESLCDEFKEAVVGPNFGNADHLSVFMKPYVETTHSSRIIKVYDYRESHVAAFVETLKSQPWQNLYRSEDSIETKCDLFYSFVSRAQSCIPHSEVIITSRDKPWITPTLKLLINHRYEAYRQRHFDKYNHYKAKIKVEITKAKSAWLQKLKDSPHGIWKAIPTSDATKHGNIQHLFNQYASANDLASSLNSMFSSTFSEPSHIDPEEIGQSSSDEIWNIDISTEIVSDLLKKLKSGKSAGNDNLSPRLLKASCDVLANPLTHLFVSSVSTCQIPKRWKEAIVAPIPKTQKPSFNDFRPVSLLNIPSKILEKLVLNSVKSRLIASYGANQYGFRPGSSTLNAHVAIHEFVTRQLDLSPIEGVAMIAMDLSKAFDRLSHRSLLLSLIHAGLPRNFIKWTSNFLSDRKQKVVFQGATSKNEIKVTSGVPQGSILAPYFFAFHLGSLTPVSQDTILIKFADDITILIPFEKFTNPSKRVQEEIQNVKDWCDKNGLVVNQDKTKSILFKKSLSCDLSLGDFPNVKPHLTILGVIFENSLKWDLHVDSVTKKASRRIHVLKMLKKIPTATKKDLLQVYHNYIQSVMEYNSPLFVGMNSKNNTKLERINKRCHWIICGIDCKCNAFPPMNERRLKQAMKFFTKIMNPNNISNHLLPHQLPRTRHLYIDYIRTDRRAKSFIPFCSLISNSRR